MRRFQIPGAVAWESTGLEYVSQSSCSAPAEAGSHRPLPLEQSMSPKSVKRFWDDDMLKQQSMSPKSEDAGSRGQKRSKTKTYCSFLNHFVRDAPRGHDAYAGHSFFQRNRV
jgi:hypothetical protein